MSVAIRGYIILTIALAAVYLLVPVARPTAIALIGATAVTAVCLGVWRQRPARWRAWLALAAAATLITGGEVIFVASAGMTNRTTFPGPPALAFLLAYLPLAVALYRLGQPRLRRPDLLMIVDVTALSLATGLLTWIFIGRPIQQRADLAGVALFVQNLSWAGYAVVFAFAVRIWLSWRNNVALALVGVGVLVYLASSVELSRQIIGGTWTTGSLSTLGPSGLGVFCGAAALTTSMARPQSSLEPSDRVGPLRMAILAAALLVTPAVLLYGTVSGSVPSVVAVALVGVAIGVLVLIRIGLTAAALRRRQARSRSITGASLALLSAASSDEVLAGVANAVAVMLPDRGCVRVSVAPDVSADMSGPATPIVRRDDDIADLTLPLRAGAGLAGGGAPDRRSAALVFTAPAPDLWEASAQLVALTELAGSALQRIDLVARLHAEERERYFRTLVLTSTDVTLISRHGRIDYATPSASSMFGRDVHGLPLEEAVRRIGPVCAEQQPAWPESLEGEDGQVVRPDGTENLVFVHRRDLTADPTISGVVTTLRDVTRERVLQRELAYRASHDPLTGLANGEVYRGELSEAGQARPNERADGGAVWRAALMVDLDDFKGINDVYGHETGDRVLVETATRITSCLRAGDVAARIGGDEFAVLLPDIPDPGAAYDIAQRIADAMARPTMVPGTSVACRASVGVACSTTPFDPEQLLRQADQALYSAKAHGKGRAVA
jgi:diguanylate cyclase (GGDEF)-like protein